MNTAATMPSHAARVHVGSPISPDETEAILRLCLIAALADGEKHGREREQIRRIAESTRGSRGGPHVAHGHDFPRSRQTKKLQWKHVPGYLKPVRLTTQKKNSL